MDESPTAYPKNSPFPFAAAKDADISNLDEFAIASLVEARLKGLLLSQEEAQLLTYIQQDPALSQEYYGLLAVMRSLDDAPSATTNFYYLLSDQKNNLQRVEETQIQRRLFLLKGGARLTGVEFEAQTRLPLAAFGLVVEFSDSNLVRLLPAPAPVAPRAIAETGLLYQFQDSPSVIDWATWRLQATTARRLFEFTFDQAGSVQLPDDLPSVLSWKLLKIE